jgi:hypothetical protein
MAAQGALLFGATYVLIYRSERFLPSGRVAVESVHLAHQLDRLGIAEQHPDVAPLPVATLIDLGVASPSAQGQAIMRTATALISACAMRGSGPRRLQTTKVTAATRTTMGTK